VDRGSRVIETTHMVAAAAMKICSNNFSLPGSHLDVRRVTLM
jgi:hypothetical protein